MKFRPDHLQHIAAAKAGFSERTARRIETRRPVAPQPNVVRTRQGPDPFDGLWDSEIRPLLETYPGLRPVAVLEEMQRRHPDHDWDRLRRSLERRVPTWRSQHGADREVIFRQDHVPGQQALSDFTDMADAGVSIAGQTLDHRPVSLRAGLLGLGACRAGAWRGKFHRACRWPAERALFAWRRAGRAPF